MFLEPVYLNETMLMNCASYFFKGISLEAETISNTENSKKYVGFPPSTQPTHHL